jgi:hypothetical protein
MTLGSILFASAISAALVKSMLEVMASLVGVCAGFFTIHAPRLDLSSADSSQVGVELILFTSSSITLGVLSVLLLVAMPIFLLAGAALSC